MSLEQLTDKQEIAILGDVHGKDYLVNKSIELVADKTDLIIQVGDFRCYDDKRLHNVSTCAQANNVRIVFIPGNHEEWSDLNAFSVNKLTPLTSNVIYAPRGSQGKIGAKNALFFGGGHSIDRKRRETWSQHETINEYEAQKFADDMDNNVDIMLTHDVPAQVKLPLERFYVKGFPRDVEMEAFVHREALDIILDKAQPEFLAHGHYHYYYEQMTQRYENNVNNMLYETKTLGVGKELEPGSLFLLDVNNDYHVDTVI